MLRKSLYLLLTALSGAAMAADQPSVTTPTPVSSTTTPTPAAITTKPAAPSTASSTIVVAGSDLLQVAIGEPLSRYVKHSGLDAKVDLFGTEPALAKLKNNQAQLAIIAAPLGQEPKLPGCETIKLCFQVDYILVNKDNPLTALNLHQIAAVFAAGQDNFTRWDKLQVAGDWSTRPILPCTTSTDDGIVVELFKNTTLGRRSLDPSVRVLKTTEDFLKEMTNNPNAIGISGFDPGPPSKVLLISAQNPTNKNSDESATPDAVRPTEQSVYSGDYVIQLPFYIVYKTADKTRLRELLHLLLSDEYAAHLQDEHFMPVSKTLRDRSALELDKTE